MKMQKAGHFLLLIAILAIFSLAFSKPRISFGITANLNTGVAAKATLPDSSFEDTSAAGYV